MQIPSMYVCVCVWIYTHTHIYGYICTHTYISQNIYISKFSVTTTPRNQFSYQLNTIVLVNNAGSLKNDKFK